MDRNLDAAERRSAWWKRSAPALAGLAVAGAALAALPGAFTPRVERESVRTARVERGDVRLVLEATGVVVPASESVVTCPIASRLLRVIRRPGDRVAAGDPIVLLDDAAARAERARLEDRVASLRLQREQAALEMASDLGDRAGREESRRLEASVAETRLARWEKLHDEGLASDEQLDERKLEARRAAIDVAGLAAARAAALASGRARLHALDLDIRQAERERDEAARTLARAAAPAGEDGVVTWVLDETGAAVDEGQPVARVARLDAYRIEARVSDAQAQRLSRGLPVSIRTGTVEMTGIVANVDPAIAAGALTFDVALDEPSHPALRPSLRVDAWITTGERQDVLRLPRPAGSAGGARGHLYVIEGSRANRREVLFGAAGPREIEIVEGLATGDEVIVSDTSAWTGAARLRLKETNE